MTKIAPVIPREFFPEGFESLRIERVAGPETIRDWVDVDHELRGVVGGAGGMRRPLELDASEAEQLVHALTALQHGEPEWTAPDERYRFILELRWAGQHRVFHIDGVPTDESLAGVLSLAHEWIDGGRGPITARAHPSG